MKRLLALALLFLPSVAASAELDQIPTVITVSQDSLAYKFADYRVFADLSHVNQATRDSLRRTIWCLPTDGAWATTKFLVDSATVKALKTALKVAGVDTLDSSKWSQVNISLSDSAKADVLASGLSDKATIVKFLNIITSLRAANPSWDVWTARAAAKGVATKF